MNLLKRIKKIFENKEKPKNWPHQIIEFLYQHYSETTTELNRFCYEVLKLSPDNTTHKDKIKDTLNALKTEGYLTWLVIKWEYGENGEEKQIDAFFITKFHTEPDITFRWHRVEAQLTIKGIDYAIELRREKQKHKIFIWATPAGAFFALIAAIMSIANYKGCVSEPLLQKQEIIISKPQDTIPPAKPSINPDHLQSGEKISTKYDSPQIFKKWQK